MEKIVSLALILPITLACVLISTPPLGETNFPLQQVTSLPIDGEIGQIAVAETWMAVSTQKGKLIAIDLETQNVLWEINFPVILWSNGLLVQNDILIAASQDQIITVDRAGTKKEINLDDDVVTVINMPGIYSGYLYILGGSNWTLEAYDISKNTLLWKTQVGRGGADNVFYNSSNDIAYVAGGSISAFNNSKGDLIWEQTGNVLISTFEDGVLYVFEEKNLKDHYQIAAIDVSRRKELWSRDFVFQPADNVNQLTILGDLLVASAGDLIALDKSTGDQIWRVNVGETFYTAPIEFDRNLYGMGGASSTVFAVSPKDGSILGTVNLEEDDIFLANSLGRVHKLEDGIVFNTTDAVVIYKGR